MNLTPADLGLPADRFPSFRRKVKQEETIIKLATSEYEASVFQAPTGAGKSLSYFSVRRLAGYSRALYLVGTKDLGQQLYRDFSSSGLYDIVGHGNYSCAKSASDEDGQNTFYCEGNCQYRSKVTECLKHDDVTTNFAHWVSIAKAGDPDRLGKFDLLVCDEAHLVPDKLVDYLAVTIRPQTVHRLLRWSSMPASDASVSRWVEWAKEADQRAQAAIQAAGNLPRDDNRYRTQVVSSLNKLRADLARITQHAAEGKWIATTDTHGNPTLKPIWAKDYAREYLFRGIGRILLVSATATADTAHQLGLAPGEYEMVEVDSGFDVARRPFIYVPTVRVDHRMGEGEWRVLMNRVDKVVGERLDRRGLIHSRSYDRAEEIRRRSRFASAIATHGKHDRERVIQSFMNADMSTSDISVLCSPSCEEGRDFHGDRCRYQILFKVPHLDRRDPVTKARLLDDPKYGDVVTAQTIMQMYGRSTRSESDWSESMIFDDHWSWFRKRVRWARWFRIAWRQENTIPRPLNFA